MKVILDTNVIISGIFFPSGPPRQILETWNKDKISLVISPEIFDEYNLTASELHNQYPTVNINHILELLLLTSEMCHPKKLSKPVCEDPKDDMFIACALASNTQIIVSGDKHLLKISGYQNIKVLKPRVFLDKYL